MGVINESHMDIVTSRYMSSIKNNSGWDTWYKINPGSTGFKVQGINGYTVCIDNFLPQELDDDWFEVVPLKPAKINYDHITKPTSMNYYTYDIKGVIPKPKYIVSPWLNSTIEPDTDMKPIL